MTTPLKKLRGAAAKRGAAVPGAGLTDETLARELGVAVGLVAQIRAENCEPSIDLATTMGVPVFTEAGRAKVTAAVEMRMAAAEKSGPRVPPMKAQWSTLPTENLIITRIFRASPRLLANRSNGNEVVVQVRTAEMLRPGMILIGCQQGNMGWYYHGRLPRILGEQQLYYPSRISAH